MDLVTQVGMVITVVLLLISMIPFEKFRKNRAVVVELADTQDLKPCAEERVGSKPTSRTKDDAQEI